MNYKVTSSLRPIQRAVRNPGQYSLKTLGEHRYAGEALGGRVKVEGTSEGDVLSKLNTATKQYLDKGDPAPNGVTR